MRTHTIDLRLGLATAAAALLTACPLGAEPKEAPPPTIYALLFVSREEPRVRLGGLARPDAREEFESYRQTQAAMIKSRLVLNAALRQPKVSELPVVRGHADPVAWLEGALRVDFSRGPEIMRVGLNGAGGAAPEGVELAAVVDAVVGAYLADFHERQVMALRRRMAELTELNMTSEKRLQRLRQMLRQAEAEVSGLTALERQTQAQTFLDCQRELRRVRLALAAARERPAKDREAAAAEVKGLEAQEKLLSDELEQLKARAAQADRRGADRLDELKVGIELAEQTLKRVIAEIEQAGIEERAPSRVQLLEAADKKDDAKAGKPK
jgi:hypothetical protein